jgi:hypothetical protein
MWGQSCAEPIAVGFCTVRDGGRLDQFYSAQFYAHGYGKFDLHDAKFGDLS